MKELEQAANTLLGITEVLCQKEKGALGAKYFSMEELKANSINNLKPSTNNLNRISHLSRLELEKSAYSTDMQPPIQR